MRCFAFSFVAALISTAAVAQDDAPEADGPFADAPLVREAGTLSLYLDDVDTLSEEEIADVDTLNRALEIVAANRFEDLSPGSTAFGALLAAQSPEFIDGVRQVADYYGRSDLLTGLRNDPTYAGYFPGADAARAVVTARIGESASRVRSVAERIHRESYALQNEDWANSRMRDAQGRITALQALAMTRRTAPVTVLESIAAPGVYQRRRFRANQDEALLAAFNETFGLSPLPEAAPLTFEPAAQDSGVISLSDRALTLAALEALNENSPAEADALLVDPTMQSCLNLVRAQFDNCVGVAAYRYEDVACIAQFGLTQVAACISASNQ